MSVTATTAVVITDVQQIKKIYSNNMADSISTSSTKDEDELATVMAKKPSKEKLRLSHSEIELRRCLSDTESSFEPLLKQYSCAWHNGSILIQGHIYITANFVCFYSNILSWETKLIIKFREIISIFKQRTALVFPNAIAVATLQHQYLFTSFIHRNNAFKVLQCTWKNNMKGIILSKMELLNLLQSKKTPDEEEEISNTESVDDTTTHSNDTSPELPHDINNIPLSTTDSILTTDEVHGDHHFNERMADEFDGIDSCLATQSMSTSSSTDIEIDGVRKQYELVEDSFDISDIETIHNDSVVDYSHSHSHSRVENTPQIEWTFRGRPFSDVINTVIILLITVLIFSMLFLICKLSEIDPNLRPWLSWQPWCHFICTNR